MEIVGGALKHKTRVRSYATPELQKTELSSIH